MRVLVTGANGFIGSRVASALSARGTETYALVRDKLRANRLSALPNVRVVVADVHDSASMAALVATVAPSVTIHCAWYAEPGKYLAAVENVTHVASTLSLAHTLAAAGCRRFVGLGTCFEYDTDLGWLSESSMCRPRHLYSAAKLATWLMLEQLAASTAMTVAWARLFYQYGPDEDERRLVPYVVSALLDGRPAEVSKGEQIRDYLHVDDVANAVVAVAESELGGPVNIGSGRPVSVRTLVETIARVVGRPDLVKFGARLEAPSDPAFVCANTHVLRDGTSWRARHDLEEGISSFVNARRESAR